MRSEARAADAAARRLPMSASVIGREPSGLDRGLIVGEAGSCPFEGEVAPALPEPKWFFSKLLWLLSTGNLSWRVGEARDDDALDVDLGPDDGKNPKARRRRRVSTTA